MKKTNSAKGGLGMFGVLLIVFVALKFTGLITWSWWWVLSPLWIPAVLVVLMAILLAVTLMFPPKDDEDYDN